MNSTLHPAALISLMLYSGNALADRAPQAPAASKFTCPVTVPAQAVRGYTNYGNEALATLVTADGRIVFEPGGPGIELADGSLSMKSGWWRLREGRLTIEGKRLDKPGHELRADMSGDYGKTGFRPVTLIFSTPGCWQISGQVAGVRLSYVALVEKIGDGTCSKERRQPGTLAGSLESKDVRVVLATTFDDGSSITHTHGEHAYVGGIEGSGVFDFVTHFRADGSSTFSGFERLSVSIHGVSRSFFASHNGTIEDGISRSVWTVDADPNSRSPTALAGRGTLSSGKDNRACYSLTMSP